LELRRSIQRQSSGGLRVALFVFGLSSRLAASSGRLQGEPVRAALGRPAARLTMPPDRRTIALITLSGAEGDPFLPRVSWRGLFF
jgi:hypothetical protein